MVVFIDVDPESWRLRLASVPMVKSDPVLLQSLTRAEDMKSARGLRGLDWRTRHEHTQAIHGQQREEKGK